jgi:hypothetical protein
MSTEENKAKIELDIFRSFLKKAPFSIDKNSEKKVFGQKKPDIVCTIKGKVTYFELTSNCSSDIAKNIAHTIKANESEACFAGDNTEDTVLSKINKEYDIQESVELIVYYDGRNGFNDDVIKHNIEKVLSHGLGQFSKIWFYGRKKTELIATKNS